MKREVKFRGKDVESGEWVAGYGFQYFDGLAYLLTYRNAVEVIPETVGQFTGLLDKNGEEIFQSDIVNANYLWGGTPSRTPHLSFVTVRCEVVWHESGCWHLRGINEKQAGVFERVSGQWYRRFPQIHLPEDYGIEKIGNAFDNPELLEAQ